MNQPAIVQVRKGNDLHFMVIESICGDRVRVLDDGAMRVRAS